MKIEIGGQVRQFGSASDQGGQVLLRNSSGQARCCEEQLKRRGYHSDEGNAHSVWFLVIGLECEKLDFFIRVPQPRGRRHMTDWKATALQCRSNYCGAICSLIDLGS